MNKMAIASFAVLVLGSSAAVAQPYGYGRYGYDNGYGPTRSCQYQHKAYDYEQFRTGNMQNIMICIKDPATDQVIDANEYRARYPWSDPTTWTYDAGSDLWGDHTQEQYGRQYSYNRDYSRDYGNRDYRDYRDRGYQYRRYRD